VAKGAFSGIHTAERMVVRDQVAWEKLWHRHQPESNKRVAPPSIDFARDMLLIAAMGRQRSGGYAIEFSRAELIDARLRVWVRSKQPSPGQVQIQALTAPFVIVVVPRSEAEVEFIDVGERSGSGE
jgi:hypothetical protein